MAAAERTARKKSPSGWVSEADVRAPGFTKETLRQSRLAAHSRLADEDQAFVDAISDVKL